MSDSLLNLLEVLNEVLEEQKLQEQAPGGAPTEEQLWDIVSSGLQDFVDNGWEKEQTRNNFLRRRPGLQFYREQLKSRNLYYAFGIIEYILRKATAEKPKYETQAAQVRETLRDVGAWLLRLNRFYYQNEGNPSAKIKNAIDAIYYSKRELPFAAGKGNSAKIAAFLMYGTDSPFSKIGIFTNNLTSGNLQRNDLPIFLSFLDLLKEGKGVLLGSKPFLNQKYDNTFSAVADPKNFLTSLDYKQATLNLLSGDTKLALRTLTAMFMSLRIDREYDFDYKEHKKKILQILDSSFKQILKMPAYRDALSKQLAFTYVKGERYNTIRDRDFVDKIYDFIETTKKIIDYKDKLAKSGSGETFTSPKISPYKKTERKDFDLVIKNFFGDDYEKPFNEKLKKMTEKMEVFSFQGEELSDEINKMNVIDFTNRVLLMEYFIEMSKGFSAQSAGLLFEYFLAKLFGGEVVGQRKDAVDFEIKKDGRKVKGSSKLVTGDTTSRQAVSSFLPHKNDKIYYVIGKKSASGDKPYEKGKYPEPTEIEKVDIYSFEVIFENKTFTKDGLTGHYLNVIQDGEEVQRDDLWINTKGGGRFDFRNLLTEDNKVGTLQLMITTKERIKGFRERVREAVRGDAKYVLDKIGELFKNLRLADEKSRIYTSSGDVSDGTDAMNALTDSQTNLREIGDYAFKDKPDEYGKLPEPNDA